MINELLNVVCNKVSNSVRMREIADQNNSAYGHFLRSVF